jgi:hypothetical protein
VVQVEGSTLERGCQLMHSTLKRLESVSGEEEAQRLHGVLCDVLTVMEANLRRAVVSGLSPTQLFGSDADAVFQRLRDTLAAVTGAEEVPPTVLERVMEAEGTGGALLFTTPEARWERFKGAVPGNGVVEIELSWPGDDTLAGTTPDGPSVTGAQADALVLQLQQHARKSGWRAVVHGRWPAKLYLLMEVTHEKQGAALAFLQRQLPHFFAITGLAEEWSTPDGCTKPEIPLKLERSAGWDRAGRLTTEPSGGVVRIYVSGISLEDVEAGLCAFFL